MNNSVPNLDAESPDNSSTLNDKFETPKKSKNTNTFSGYNNY
jgi:hypothetical protein